MTMNAKTIKKINKIINRFNTYKINIINNSNANFDMTKQEYKAIINEIRTARNDYIVSINDRISIEFKNGIVNIIFN